MKECEHIIGMIYEYEESRLATVANLIEHIENTKRYFDMIRIKRKILTLSDYCDMRKSVDMTRFKHCPLCGAKIDWKAIKESDTQ